MARLRFALIGILVLFTAAFAVGGYGFYSANSYHDELVKQSVPTLIQTELTQRRLAELSSAISQLETGETLSQLTIRFDEIEWRVSELRAITGSENWESGSELEREGIAVELDGLLKASNTTLEARRDVVGLESGMVTVSQELAELRARFRNLTEPLVLNATTAFDIHLKDFSASKARGNAEEKDLLHDDLFILNSLARLAFQLGAAVDLAEQTALSRSFERSRKLHDQFRLRVRSVTQLLTNIPAADGRAELARNMKRLRTLFVGEEGILRRLAMFDEARRALADAKTEQRESVLRIVALSDALVQRARSRITKSTSELDEVWLHTLIVVGAIGLTALGLVVLVVVFVVEKQINGRMRALTIAVREIADGNNDYVVGVEGKDELAEIAAALEVFRANALELTRSNRELENYVHVAAHDLRSPLRGIRSLAEWTLTDEADSLTDHARRNLEMINQRTNRLSRLLTDLLEYSMVGRVQDDVQPVTIGEMVREVGEALNETGDFRINYDGPMAEVVTHGTSLRQIILNLLSNSIKHHDRPDGEVTVELRIDRQRLFFTVRDDGPGIEKAYHERIFGLFQTLKSRDEVEGSGLGLAIIRKSVEFHGGTVSVASDPTVGRGTSFIFDLPDLTDV